MAETYAFVLMFFLAVVVLLSFLVPVLVLMLPLLVTALSLVFLGVVAFGLMMNMYRGPVMDAEGRPMVIKNKDIRRYLETSAMKGDMSKHPNYAKFPLKGVHMFTNLGGYALVDFSQLENWDEDENTFEINMTKACLYQSGWSCTQGSMLCPFFWTAFIPGGPIMRVFRAIGYWNKFYLPSKDALKEGKKVQVAARCLGLSYAFNFEGKLGFTQYFTEHDGGKMYDRDTFWLYPHFEFHEYKLWQVVDKAGKIDEDGFKMLMDKIGDQDLYYGHEAAAPKVKLS
mmetsp:Transcript_127942/g.331739  ORF Transcript_127942/g.331739 Transcript_127942/m.331739 type:complete len:284 (+) Transcript_127942:96-947(+)